MFKSDILSDIAFMVCYMNDKYAIFFDLDGTLMENPSKVYPKIEQLLIELKKNGHLCFVATGRGYSNVPDVLKSPMSGFITNTGATCVIDNEKIISHEVPKDILIKFAKYCFEIGAPLFIENDKEMNLLKNLNYQYDSDVDFMRGYTTETFTSIDELLNYDDLWANKFDTRISYKEKIDEFEEIKNGYFEALDAGEGWYEIIQKGINKGIAIKEVSSKLGIDINNTICIGDSGNDLAMFDVCGIRIAVDNALKEVKEKATVILQGNNQDALIEYFIKIGLVESI